MESKTQHTNNCNPSAINCVVAAQRSGIYTDKIPSHVIYVMCDHVDDEYPLTAQSIRHFYDLIGQRKKKSLKKTFSISKRK